MDKGSVPPLCVWAKGGQAQGKERLSPQADLWEETGAVRHPGDIGWQEGAMRNRCYFQSSPALLLLGLPLFSERHPLPSHSSWGSSWCWLSFMGTGFTTDVPPGQGTLLPMSQPPWPGPAQTWPPRDTPFTFFHTHPPCRHIRGRNTTTHQYTPSHSTEVAWPMS